MYIRSYGLTRLRVLTQVVMLWLGLTTVLVAVWLFVPKFPYMNAVIATALTLGALVLWADVDIHVARYNVNHYLSGDLQQIDLKHLHTRNTSAVPHIALLGEQAPDARVRRETMGILGYWYLEKEDFRSWNYVNYIARSYLPQK